MTKTATKPDQYVIVNSTTGEVVGKPHATLDSAREDVKSLSKVHQHHRFHAVEMTTLHSVFDALVGIVVGAL